MQTRLLPALANSVVAPYTTPITRTLSRLPTCTHLYGLTQRLQRSQQTKRVPCRQFTNSITPSSHHHISYSGYQTPMAHSHHNYNLQTHSHVPSVPSFTLTATSQSRLFAGTHPATSTSTSTSATALRHQPTHQFSTATQAESTQAATPSLGVSAPQQHNSNPQPTPALELAVEALVTPTSSPSRLKLLQFSYIWLISSMVFFSYQMTEGYLDSSRENAKLKKELERTQDVLNQILETQQQQHHQQQQLQHQQQQFTMNQNPFSIPIQNGALSAPVFHQVDPAALYHLTHLPHFNHEYYQLPTTHQHRLAQPQLAAPSPQSRVQHQILRPTLNAPNPAPPSK